MLRDAALARDEILSAVVVRFVAVRAFEGADVGIRNERVCAFAGDNLASHYGKTLQTSFTFNQPGQSHRSIPLRQHISIKSP
jgi:hypothetical protein